VDHSKNDFNVFESGAIMIYLCDFYDPQHRLLPEDPLARSKVMQFLMFQMGGVGPMQVCVSYFNVSICVWRF
jgi:glutathione S-transferase